jgi:ketosteroid isomerase-like protein
MLPRGFHVLAEPWFDHPNEPKGAAMCENERLLRTLYEAQAGGDLEGYFELRAEDFTMHIPGSSPIAGEYRGKEDMRRHFREIAELSGGSFRTSVHDVLGSDGHAVGLINATAERGGEVRDIPRVHVWHVREGRLSALWLHPADQKWFDEYWSGGAS